MSLNGIAISGRGAQLQAARIESLAQKIAVNGQQGGLGVYGQQGGLGKNGQLVGMVDVDAAMARAADVQGENRTAPVLDSAELIRALRALEANLQAIRIQDAALERTVNEFARPAK